jgi:hypothetical protein
MARKRHKPEEIVTGVTEVTYYIYGRLSRCKSISS